MAAAVMILTGCSTTFRHAQLPQNGQARIPEIQIDPATGVSSLELSVLIYNVAGLPWPIGCGKASRTVDEYGEKIPIACNRSAALRAIGDSLGKLRRQGLEPDIVMLQEAFISAAAEIPVRAGYPNWVTGPGVSDLGLKYSGRASQNFIDERSFWKGEKLGKWQSSGLMLASNFPIKVVYKHPFNQWECAGFDCLANKGLLVAEIEVPGLPYHLRVATTHFNSRGRSGVSSERALIAHNLQLDEARDFLRTIINRDLPFIWGGDLNMRNSNDRLVYFVETSIFRINEVSAFCSAYPEDCETQFEWRSDAPWQETQDLQGWVPGNQISIMPLSMEMLFDDPVDGIMLSDHDGVFVKYRLSWPVPSNLSPVSPEIR
ncbi:Endonuclease/Exonuclease/phosphatase family protein [Nitrosomonas sp. Nm51]|nr:Endonuclease/Exonuclease/phosphatase family protein [Nitrosomonas sp. Nm51]